MSEPVVATDPARCTATITKDFAAGAERVWRLWTDPAQVALWWGPPGHRTEVVHTDLRAGGRVDFVVTDAHGAAARTCWHVHVVEPPRRLEFDFDDPRVPRVRARAVLEPLAADRTRVVLTLAFPTADAMQTLLGMGFHTALAGGLDRAHALLAG